MWTDSSSGAPEVHYSFALSKSISPGWACAASFMPSLSHRNLNLGWVGWVVLAKVSLNSGLCNLKMLRLKNALKPVEPKASVGKKSVKIPVWLIRDLSKHSTLGVVGFQEV